MAAVSECCGLGCNNCILDRFLDERARRPDLNNKTNLFNQKGYQKFRLKDIVRERAQVYLFEFELVCERIEPFKDDEQLIAAPVSYVMLRAKRDADGECNSLFDGDLPDAEEDDDDEGRYHRFQPQRFDKGTPEIYFSRKYTPFEVNEQLRTFKIIVKLEPFGKMSRYLSTLAEGSVCEFKGAFKAFDYVHEKIENYIVFTQGISIVSVFRLVKEVIYESAQTRVLVVSCFKNLNETFLREDFFKLIHFWCLKHHMYLSENVETKTPPRSGEKIHNERLTSENFRQLMRELKYFEPSRTQVLISGRESFIDFVKTVVADNKFTQVETI